MLEPTEYFLWAFWQIVLYITFEEISIQAERGGAYL
jgi:hypothetical protein